MFLSITYSNFNKHKKDDVGTYVMSSDFTEKSDLVTLDSERVYKKDDSKNISIESNSVQYLIPVKNRNDYLRFLNLFKNKKCIQLPYNSSEVYTTDDKNIYTKLKYEFQFQFYPDENGKYEKKCSPGTGLIYKDGTFEIMYRLENRDYIFLKGKFDESEMKIMKSIYDKIYKDHQLEKKNKS